MPTPLIWWRRLTAGIATRIVPSVAEALAAVEQEVVLVLDDCHVLRSGDCLDQLNLLIDTLPGARPSGADRPF